MPSSTTALRTGVILAKHASVFSNSLPMECQIVVPESLGLLGLLNPEDVLCKTSSAVWAWSPKNLFESYAVTDITSTGWMVCKPKINDELVGYKFIDLNRTMVAVESFGRVQSMSVSVFKSLFNTVVDV
jgi:hypothetical protein